MNEFCLNSIDYSTVAGNVTLPFVIALDEENSILDPGPGEFQRFCYSVTGVGEDTAQFADLSHFVFSACPDITLDMLQGISVIINGESQQVIPGTNVEVLESDPTTGCRGVKFDFGLDKVAGEMTVCFSLTQAYDIGPMPVCLRGGQQSSSGLSICGPVCAAATSCPAVGSLRATVCVPVTITPFATVGTPMTVCCGDPVITSGVSTCAGTPLGTCSFSITQDVCMSVPVTFGATADVGDYTVQCQTATGTACAGCGDEPVPFSC